MNALLFFSHTPLQIFVIEHFLNNIHNNSTQNTTPTKVPGLDKCNHINNTPVFRQIQM